MKSFLCSLAGLLLGSGVGFSQPMILSPPGDSINLLGATATFSVVATGAPPLQYQWRFAPDLATLAPVPGATNAMFAVTNVAAPGGWCDVLVSNAQCAVTSAPARLVSRVPLTFAVQPRSQIVTQGTRVTFWAQAAEGTFAILSWQRNGRPLNEGFQGELTLINVQPSYAGDYTCVAYDGFAYATSSVARLQVVPLPGVSWSFVNFETPPVHPLALSPDRATLAVCNLPDHRLELFDVRTGFPAPLGSVSVGMDPVSVRFRTPTEAWVVNHISDSISVVDVGSRRVLATIKTMDTPADVIFAGNPLRAFVSCAMPNVVQVFDPITREAVGQVPIKGERPKALAVSRDGLTVYAAIFESGNGSTILGAPITALTTVPLTLEGPVNMTNGPYGGQNPPPNRGSSFSPTIATNLSSLRPPPVSHIVKKTRAGRWLDDNGSDWTEFVSGDEAPSSDRIPGWDLPDRDLAMIDTATLSVRYAGPLMNLCMELAVHPTSGQIAVVGTDALNEIRFEPNLNGIFLRVQLALVDPSDGAAVVKDLNPHLDYTVRTVRESERIKSLGDPRAVVWSRDGARAYIAGMGSQNVVVLDATGNRVGPLPLVVGEGPAGLALDDDRRRLYVLNRFSATLSVIDTAAPAVIGTVPFFDPTPTVIKAGRRHLYDTHKSSGLGHVSCASCHPDARMDRLAWDLGDPSGRAVTNSRLDRFHPMKGPMVTITLQDIIGHEPLHWRGDRRGIEEFNPTFTQLLSATNQLTRAEMNEFKTFLGSIHFPPNPFREFDNTLSTNVPLPGQFALGLRNLPAGTPLPNGDARRGGADFAVRNCIGCHHFPAGLSGVVGPPDTNGNQLVGLQNLNRNLGFPFKGVQLRNLAEKTGMDTASANGRAGFGFSFDGRADSLTRFLQLGFSRGDDDDQQTANMIAFIFSFSGSDLPMTAFPESPTSKDVPAAVGRQLTLADTNYPPLLDAMLTLAGTWNSRVELIAKGAARGWVFEPLIGDWQSDRAGERRSTRSLLATVGPGNELTFTVVPAGTGRRLGVDRDEDGYLDRDEIDFGSDPARATSIPLRVRAQRDPAGERLAISWNSVPGRVYRAEFAERVDTNSWRALGSNRFAEAASMSVTESIVGRPQRFYRVVAVD